MEKYFFAIVDDLYGADPEGPLVISNRDDDVVVPPLNVALSENLEANIVTINPLPESDVMGVDIYLQYLMIISDTQKTK